MAVNYLAGLDQQTADNNDIRKANNGILKLGRKNAELVRIIPYLDRRFWYPYRTCWVDLFYTKGNHKQKTYPSMLIFPYNDNGDDKLRTLIGQIIGANKQYRQDAGITSGDKIPLQFKHPGHAHYDATLRPRFALQAIDIVQDPATKKDIMNTFPKSNIPKPQIMNVSKTVLQDIKASIISKDPEKLKTFGDSTKKGKPYPLDPTNATKMRWINTEQSFPVHIYLDDKNNYHVDAQVFDLLGALPKELYTKDSKGNYKYLDDPAYLYAPTKVQAPQIYKIAYTQLKKRFDEYKESGDNPYADQLKRVAKNTGHSQPDSVIAGQGSDDASNPFSTQPLSRDAATHRDNTINSATNSNFTSSKSSSNDVSGSGSSNYSASPVSMDSTSKAPSSKQVKPSSPSAQAKPSSSSSASVDPKHIPGLDPKAQAVIDKVMNKDKK